MQWETGQEQGNEQLCEILAFYLCASGTHDTKQLPYFVQQLVAFRIVLSDVFPSTGDKYGLKTELSH